MLPPGFFFAPLGKMCCQETNFWYTTRMTRERIKQQLRILAPLMFPGRKIHVDGNLHCWAVDSKPRQRVFIDPKPIEEAVSGPATALEEAMRGKRVIVVGGAPLDEGTGEYIDSFDMVIRVNNGYRAVKKAPSRVGTRTDVIYHCCGVGHPDDYPHPQEWGDIPVVLTIRKSHAPHKLAWLYVRSLQGGILPRKVLCPNEGLFIRYGRSAGFSALHSGTFAMIHAAKFASEVHTAGITFFRDGYDPAYKNWSEEKAKEYANKAHDVERELRSFVKVIPHNLKPCPKLDRILKDTAVDMVMNSR